MIAALLTMLTGDIALAGPNDIAEGVSFCTTQAHGFLRVVQVPVGRFSFPFFPSEGIPRRVVTFALTCGAPDQLNVEDMLAKVNNKPPRSDGEFDIYPEFPLMEFYVSRDRRVFYSCDSAVMRARSGWAGGCTIYAPVEPQRPNRDAPRLFLTYGLDFDNRTNIPRINARLEEIAKEYLERVVSKHSAP
jgi:hypothetical protein